LGWGPQQWCDSLDFLRKSAFSRPARPPELHLRRAVAVAAVARQQVLVGDVVADDADAIRQPGENPDAFPRPIAPAAW